MGGDCSAARQPGKPGLTRGLLRPGKGPKRKPRLGGVGYPPPTPYETASVFSRSRWGRFFAIWSHAGKGVQQVGEGSGKARLSWRPLRERNRPRWLSGPPFFDDLPEVRYQLGASK